MKVEIEIPDGEYCNDCVLCTLPRYGEIEEGYCVYLDKGLMDEAMGENILKDCHCPNPPPNLP